MNRSTYVQYATRLKSVRSQIWEECKVQVAFHGVEERGTTLFDRPVHIELQAKDRNRMKQAKAMLYRCLAHMEEERIQAQEQPSNQENRIRLTKTKNYKLLTQERVQDLQAVLGTYTDEQTHLRKLRGIRAPHTSRLASIFAFAVEIGTKLTLPIQARNLCVLTMSPTHQALWSMAMESMFARQRS